MVRTCLKHTIISYPRLSCYQPTGIMSSPSALRPWGGPYWMSILIPARLVIICQILKEILSEMFMYCPSLYVEVYL